MPEPNVTDWFPSLSLLPTSPGKGAPAPGGAAQIPRHPGAASTLPSFVRPDRPHRASDPALPGTAHQQPGTTSSTPARAAAREQGAELCVCLCPRSRRGHAQAEADAARNFISGSRGCSVSSPEVLHWFHEALCNTRREVVRLRTETGRSGPAF